MDSWFIISMCIMVPAIVVLAICAFMPMPHRRRDSDND